MRIVLAVFVVTGVLGLILFGSAGRFDLPFVWTYVGVAAAGVAWMMAVIDPELARERRRPGAGGEDRALRMLVAPFLLAHLVVAGLDIGRLHLADTVPVWAQAVGLAAMVLGGAVPIAAIAVNRFFSPVVRIQEERGHHIVTAGPYRYVRHPGYAGALLAFPGAVIGLGSWLALVPLGVAMALLVRRTVIEDRYLRAHLDGYVAYTERVRWRLVPGVW